MKLGVKVKPNARKDEVLKIGEELVVKTRAQSQEGKANQAVIELLAEYFGVPRSSVKIVSGITSRNKIVEVTTRD